MRYLFWSICFIVFGICAFLWHMDLIHLFINLLKYWPLILIYFGIDLILKYFFGDDDAT